MEFISVSSSSLGEFGSLSPELWIASQLASNVKEGTPLSDIVKISSETRKPNDQQAIILDTGSANNGLLNIRIHEVGSKKRTSTKKVFYEGDIIISRLRPYLRQVAYIPRGTFKLLDVSAGYCSTEFYVLRSINNSNIAFLVKWLLSREVQKMIGGAATGGHHPRFDKTLIINSNVPLKYQNKKSSEVISTVALEYLRNQISMKAHLNS